MNLKERAPGDYLGARSFFTGIRILKASHIKYNPQETAKPALPAMLRFREQD